MPKVILIDCFVWQKQQRSDIVLRDTRGGMGSARDDSGEWHGGRELLSTRLRRVCLKVSLILQLVYLVKSSGSENREKQHTSLRPEKLNCPSSSLLLRPAPRRSHLHTTIFIWVKLKKKYPVQSIEHLFLKNESFLIIFALFSSLWLTILWSGRYTYSVL